MGIKRHKWTEEECLIVRRDYKGTLASAGDIGNRLGVSQSAVRSKALKMGLCGTRSPLWSAEEKRILQRLAQKQPIRLIAKRFPNRSARAVQVKAVRLGLRIRARDGWFTKSEVCDILGVDRRKAQYWMDIGALKATWHNGRKPRQNGTHMWHIETKDLKDFIVKHPDELQGRNVDLQQLVWIITGNIA